MCFTIYLVSSIFVRSPHRDLLRLFRLLFQVFFISGLFKASSLLGSIDRDRLFVNQSSGSDNTTECHVMTGGRTLYKSTDTRSQPGGAESGNRV